MRVLRILTRANLGGPARQVRALAPHFAALGVDETIAVGSLAAGEVACALGEGARVVAVPGMRRGFAPLADRRALRALRELVREHAPQLVHTHTAKAGLLGVRLARATGLPLVHTYHGHVLRDYFSAPVSAAFRSLERRMARRRDAMTCVSASCARELAELGVRGRAAMRVVVPAVAAQEAAGDAAERLQLEDDGRLRVAWCGRLERVKDPELLVEVLREFASAGRGLQLRVFGTGSMEPRLRAGLAGLAHVDARLAGAEPRFAAWIGAFDVLLATSRREGFPLAGIEALLAGCPVVAPRVPGFEDLEGDGVQLCERSAGALAGALARISPQVQRGGRRLPAPARRAPPGLAKEVQHAVAELPSANRGADGARGRLGESGERAGGGAIRGVICGVPTSRVRALREAHDPARVAMQYREIYEDVLTRGGDRAGRGI